MAPKAVYTNLNECFQAAMAYVILSRITNLDQLYLNKFDPKKIYCNDDAKKESAKLKERSINLIPTPWNTQQNDTLKISTLNMRSFNNHWQDLKEDKLLISSDIIAIQETWLTQAPQFSIPDFFTSYVNAAHKGIALLTRKEPTTIQTTTTEHATLLKATFSEFNLINVYRYSNNSNLQGFFTELSNLIDPTVTTLCLGDFNIDLHQSPQNAVTAGLNSLGFHQLTSESTHIMGGLLDHIYFLSQHNARCNIFTITPQYWSDHDAVCCILKL